MRVERKILIKFFVAFFLIFIIDQYIKYLFLHGLEWHSKCISLTLAINKGVAFSMFAFLGEYLKYIQLFLILILLYVFYKEKLLNNHPLISGILFAAAFSNLFDRFVRDGVVDYVYWHCGFDFAIFNFADVCIDFAILMFAYYYFFGKISNQKVA
ncbi:signal peptidase II [Nautilia profundicola AmH]|uniref:Lipoprotein signal peptidase n=1 Tax=Nautilia profundicola (strain ATCC BAA-1463 / DSM 18972 / AmH) TaxID=598659 RepID=B9L5Z6_NAUPA|nr:signal peptidase II [Nautilia profundicola]ACM93047.1 signal peptidase II [Nautilia profundicola AmH]